jgi:hypothetical protein
MKKFIFLLAASLITTLSFAITTPTHTASFSSRAEMRKFIKKSGAEILATGEFKYWNVEVTPITESSVSVKVFGTNTKLVPDWNGCGNVYYGATTNNTNLYFAADAAFASFEGQGYNCVCAVETTNIIRGEFTGYQTCITVTAKVSTVCDCLM